MAATSRGQRQNSPMRVSFGTFKIHGDPDNHRITIPQDIRNYDFPVSLGDEVCLELVKSPDGEIEHMEIHPAED